MSRALFTLVFLTTNKHRSDFNGFEGLAGFNNCLSGDKKNVQQ